MIRKATENDIAAIAAIYEAIHDREEAGEITTGWLRGIYPTEQTAADSCRKGDEMYVLEEDGVIRAAGRINQEQGEEYKLCPWQYPATEQEVLVLHTLVVDPKWNGHGCATAFVAFYEDLARQMGCTCLRMDTNARNAIARRLYGHLGYAEPGIVPCVFNGIPNVQLVCLEKKL
ncbi:MAG: GNAT family N-acetyltransferase [Clostridiales bacterium]|nr:GNAT family N-acetyltransferase [Candidatus Cacconaster stercorequi]